MRPHRNAASAAGHLSREAVRSPHSAEIEAHEAVHRAQYASRGNKQIGTRSQLEAEASSGVQALQAGRTFEPRFAVPHGMRLDFSPENHAAFARNNVALAAIAWSPRALARARTRS